MSRPRVLRSPRCTLSRRAFLRRGGMLAALAGASPLGLAGADDVSLAPADARITTPFLHGVASGDPLADRVMLWTRITPSAMGADAQIPVSYIVATDPQLANRVVEGSVMAQRDRDYTVKVDVAGLAPATTYYYRFRRGSARSPIGRTRTLPVGAVDRLRIAVASCAAIGQGWFNAYGRIAARKDLDLVVHLGDYIYEFGTGEYGNVRPCEPGHEIVTLRDYRTRHNQYKTDPDLQEMHRQHPVIAIWDDHEFADNAWKGGAENHQPGSEGRWAKRVDNAVQAYYEWMPIRRVAQDRRKIARSFRIGDLAELYLLEERVTERDRQAEPNLVESTTLFTQDGAFTDRSRDLIGDQQEDWLIRNLRRSNATWKLVGQGVQFAPVRVAQTLEGENVYFNPDQWDGYKPARTRVLDGIAGEDANPVDNVVILTGDIHSSWAADLPRQPFGNRYDASTGEGSLAVEFVATSVTSPGAEDIDGQGADGLMEINPHLKYVELTRRGYLLLDVTQQRVSAEWWYVDTVLQRAPGESFGAAMETSSGTNHVEPGIRSDARPGAPSLAP